MGVAIGEDIMVTAPPVENRVSSTFWYTTEPAILETDIIEPAVLEVAYQEIIEVDVQEPCALEPAVLVVDDQVDVLKVETFDPPRDTRPLSVNQRPPPVEAVMEVKEDSKKKEEINENKLEYARPHAVRPAPGLPGSGEFNFNLISSNAVMRGKRSADFAQGYSATGMLSRREELGLRVYFSFLRSFCNQREGF